MRKKVVPMVVRGVGVGGGRGGVHGSQGGRGGGEVVPLVVRPTRHTQPLLLAALRKF